MVLYDTAQDCLYNTVILLFVDYWLASNVSATVG